MNEEFAGLNEAYSSKEEIVAALAEYNKEIKEKEKRAYYCSFWDDFKKVRIYVVCNYEQYKNWVRMLDEEKHERWLLTRCYYISSRYKNEWVLCRRGNCDECPHKDKHRIANSNGQRFVPGDEVTHEGVLSLDKAYEDYDLELPDGDYEIDEKITQSNGQHFRFKLDINSPYRNCNEEDYSNLYDAINELKEMDRKIIELVMEDKIDKEIAAILQKPKSTITSRRERLFEILGEKLKK